MKVFLFSLIYLFFLFLDISFLSNFFRASQSVSFWAFIVLINFLKKEEVVFLGALAAILSSVFFANILFFPLALFLGAVFSYILKSINGLDEKAVFIFSAFFMLIIFELLRVYIFGLIFYWQNLLGGFAGHIVFLAVLLLVMLCSEVRRRTRKGYSI